MGFFGSKKYAYDPAVATAPQEPSTRDRILNQIGMNLLGVDFIGQQHKKQLGDAQGAFLHELNGMLGPQFQNGPDANLQAPEIPGQDGAPAAQTSVGGAIRTGMFGSQAPAQPQPWQYQPPVKTGDGLNANSPQLAGLAVRAQALGVPISNLLEVLKTQQPNVQYDRGYGYDQKTGRSMGAYHTDLDKGMQPGANGQVQNAPGYVNSAAEAAGAVTGAQEQQKAAYDLVDVPLGDGRSVKMPRLMAGQILARRYQPQQSSGASTGDPNSPGGPNELGLSQSPSDASAARIVGDARATAQTTLPSDLNSVDTAIDTATQLRDHPALGMRTGGWSMLPAVPGTPGAAFEAYKAQVLGQGFMNARQALKGGGQITDYEGGKAEQAIIRAKAAQSPEDFKSAIDDYIGSLQRARGIMQQKAGVAGQSPASASRALSPPRVGQVVKGYRYKGGNPADPSSWAKQ